MSAKTGMGCLLVFTWSSFFFAFLELEASRQKEFLGNGRPASSSLPSCAAQLAVTRKRFCGISDRIFACLCTHPQTNLYTNTPRCAILLRLSTASRSLHLTDHPTAFFFLALRPRTPNGTKSTLFVCMMARRGCSLFRAGGNRMTSGKR